VANGATLLDLRTRALDYADMTSSGFAVTARLTDYVNDGLAELHEMLAMHEYILNQATINLVAGTEGYELPESFYKASRLWHLVGGRRYEIDRFTLSQLHGRKTSGPSSAGVAQLWYVPQLTRLSGDSDEVLEQLPVGWENFVALHAAVQLLIREESDPQALMAERERVKQRVMVHVEPRDIGIPDQIEDSSHRWSGCLDDLSGTTLRYRIMDQSIQIVEFEDF
jgi:hypothetical protein